MEETFRGFKFDGGKYLKNSQSWGTQKSDKDTALIKAAIEYGRMQAFNEMPVPKQIEEYSSNQLSMAAISLQDAALDNGYRIEFDENGFKAIKPLGGKLS